VDYSAYLSSPSPYAGPDWGSSLAKTFSDYPENTLNEAEEYLQRALELEGSAVYEEAVAAYRYVADNYGDSEYGSFALARLMACRVKQGDITVEKDYLISLFQKYNLTAIGRSALLWQPLVEVRSGNEQKALGFFDEIKNNYSDEDLLKQALFQKASLQLYELNDVAGAEETFAEFSQNYPDDPLTKQIVIILENYQPSDFSLPKNKPENKRIAAEVPQNFALFQNSPNPFNPETEITYQLPQNSYLQLTIFNIQGQKIKTLFNGQQSAGTHQMKWNGLDEKGNPVASGVYLCQMRAGEFVAVKKMLLLR
jgi:tetratricopeptide (TPR) repeat protein